MAATRQLIRAGLKAAPALRPGAPCRARAVAARAFLQRADAGSLTGAANAFVAAWAAGPDKGGESKLRELLAPGVVFEPDGVIFHKRLHGADAILDAMRREHGRLQHIRYEAVASAANPEERAAFVAVAWEYASKGQAEGEGTSRGMSLKQIVLDGEGRIKATRVARQLTDDEKQALLLDPSSCRPADLWSEVLPRLQGGKQGQADGQLAEKMVHSLQTWDSAWDSTGRDPRDLSDACSPNMRVLDGYGLRGSGPSIGLEEAKGIMTLLREGSYSAASLLHSAVDPATRVGFSRWEGKAEGKEDSGAQAQQLGGLDMMLFDVEGRIETLVQFTMQPYKQLKGQQ